MSSRRPVLLTQQGLSKAPGAIQWGVEALAAAVPRLPLSPGAAAQGGMRGRSGGLGAAALEVPLGASAHGHVSGRGQNPQIAHPAGAAAGR